MQNPNYPIAIGAGIALISIFLLNQNLNKNNLNSETYLPKASSLHYRHKTKTFPYDLENPDWVQTLPSELKEISGISYWQGNILLCVQDEAGRIYGYNFEKKRITVEFPFAGPGDYEDLVWVDPVLYVLRSDGDLYQIKGMSNFNTHSQKLENFLGQEQDTEGLGYDPYQNELWIACKGEGMAPENVNQDKEIYRYSLVEHTLSPKPRFRLSQSELREQLPNRKAFKPSAIAFHPRERHAYILSAASASLLVLDERGKLMFYLKLDDDLFPQAESICFDEMANLFIATEAAGKKPKLARFGYLKP